MHQSTPADLIDQVATVRAKVFPLLDEVFALLQLASVASPGRDTSTRLSGVAVDMQAAANELGAVEAGLRGTRPRPRRAHPADLLLAASQPV